MKYFDKLVRITIVGAIFFIPLCHVYEDILRSKASSESTANAWLRTWRSWRTHVDLDWRREAAWLPPPALVFRTSETARRLAPIGPVAVPVVVRTIRT